MSRLRRRIASLNAAARGVSSAIYSGDRYGNRDDASAVKDALAALTACDRTLSNAQDLVSHVLNAETKSAAPRMYAAGDDVWRLIEQARRILQGRAR